MVCKPGMHELERVFVRCDEFRDLLLGKVFSISETVQRHR